ncbi:hypothetical protein [Micromonospora globispora]|uniref:hypothetical protein n=1 Tax=Micromonospora globispora TaxID=1450148 RepID=UPI001401D978|nr:hypothetical protein [Micromonospora globispora]
MSATISRGSSVRSYASTTTCSSPGRSTSRATGTAPISSTAPSASQPAAPRRHQLISAA